MDTQDYYTVLAPPEPVRFHAWDYVVFGLVLAISAGIGVYHACTGGGQKSQKEYLMANRSMSALPVALSVLASFFSASTLLGKIVKSRINNMGYIPSSHPRKVFK